MPIASLTISFPHLKACVATFLCGSMDTKLYLCVSHGNTIRAISDELRSEIHGTCTFEPAARFKTDFESKYFESVTPCILKCKLARPAKCHKNVSLIFVNDTGNDHDGMYLAKM